MLLCLVFGAWMLAFVAAPTTAHGRGRLKRAWHAVKRRVRRPLNWTRAHITRLADKLEARAPERLKPLVRRLRNMSPFALGKFAHYKFKQDTKFLATYGVASTVVSYASLPILFSVLSPGAVLAVRAAQNVVDAGVLVWRQHHLRKDRSQTLRGTLRQLGGELAGFAEKQRVRNRRYLRLLRARKAKSAEAKAKASGRRDARGDNGPRFDVPLSPAFAPAY